MVSTDPRVTSSHIETFPVSIPSASNKRACKLLFGPVPLTAYSSFAEEHSGPKHPNCVGFQSEHSGAGTYWSC